MSLSCRLLLPASGLLSRLFHTSKFVNFIPRFHEAMEDERIQQMLNERVFRDVKPDDYQSLIQSPEDLEKIKNIIKDYEYMKYTTDQVASDIDPKQMRELMQMNSHSMRARFF